MGKVETDTRPKNGLHYHVRPIFNHSMCDLLFLLQSMLVLLVNIDDIERSNVNQVCFSFKQEDLLHIGGPSVLDYAAFSISGRAFASSHYVWIRTAVQIWLRQFAMSRPCDIFALLLYQHMLEGSHYVNWPSSLNYIFTTRALGTHNSLQIQSAAEVQEQQTSLDEKVQRLTSEGCWMTLMTGPPGCQHATVND